MFLIEGIKEMWHSFVEWLKKLWNKFTAFIYRIFGSIPGMIRSLKSAKERFGRASEAGKSFTDKWMVPGWFKAFDKSGAADKASALAEQLTKDANWEEEQKKIDDIGTSFDTKFLLAIENNGTTGLEHYKEVDRIFRGTDIFYRAQDAYKKSVQKDLITARTNTLQQLL